MMRWSEFSPEEIERRRVASVQAMKVREREEFDRRYQERCDREYWTRGQCCAGCDWWQSDMGGTGVCTAAGIMPGADVLRSIGASSCSYMPPPGFPYSRDEDWCGKFKDDFDWSNLEPDYLRRIGALEKLRRGQKPHAPTIGTKEQNETGTRT